MATLPFTQYNAFHISSHREDNGKNIQTAMNYDIMWIRNENKMKILMRWNLCASSPFRICSLDIIFCVDFSPRLISSNSLIEHWVVFILWQCQIKNEEIISWKKRRVENTIIQWHLPIMGSIWIILQCQLNFNTQVLFSCPINEIAEFVRSSNA